MWRFETGGGDPHRIHSPWMVPAVVLAVFLIIALTTPARCDWRIAPELHLSGGSESDQVIDPGLNRIVIPGGAFAELTPDIIARGWLGRRTLLSIGSFATLQQFLNDQSRLLYAQTAYGNLIRNLSGSFRGRWLISADFFNDSERESVRRLGGGTELGLMLLRNGWSVDVWGSVHGRRYPKLLVQLDSAGGDTYEEAAWSGGGTLRISPLENVQLGMGGNVQTTDSRDPDFDSNSWTATGSIDVRPATGLSLAVFGTFQERHFLERPSGLDSDQYWQVGLGSRYRILPGLEAFARWGYSKYTWPGGEDEDTRRISLGLTYGWGRRNVPPMPAFDVNALTRSSGGSVQQADRDGKIRLRIYAPGAEVVVVSGSFNSWDPDAVRLHAAGGGWWETRIELRPGSYEYTYIIDGVWTTPPETKITVDDGFGGKNGILEVLPFNL